MAPDFPVHPGVSARYGRLAKLAWRRDSFNWDLSSIDKELQFFGLAVYH